jgi:hypothetical protein
MPQKYSTQWIVENLRRFYSRCLTAEKRDVLLIFGHEINRIFRDTSKHPFEGRAPTERFQRAGVFLEVVGSSTLDPISARFQI